MIGMVEFISSSIVVNKVLVGVIMVIVMEWDNGVVDRELFEIGIIVMVELSVKIREDVILK